jgi:adenosine deaminase
MSGLFRSNHAQTGAVAQFAKPVIIALMDDDQLCTTLKTLPKIDLHRHLEGSLRLETLAELAREYDDIDLPGHDLETLRSLVQVTGDDPDHLSFLAKFKVLRRFFRSPEIIERMTYEAIADAAADNIVYLELRFNPVALANAMEYPLADVSDRVVAATERARRDFPIDVRLIVTLNRAEGPKVARKSLQVAVERMQQGIVGLDLAGDEVGYPAKPFLPVFREARRAGLHLTVHAGEWAGPENVREAIEVFDAERIGHGVRTVQDSSVVRLALERDTAFEVCVTSNMQTGVVRSLSQHPLRDLYHLGLKTTINTDDPSISDITLTGEMVVVAQHLEMSVDDIKRNILNAAQAAFLPDGARHALVKRLTDALYAPSQPEHSRSS